MPAQILKPDVGDLIAYYFEAYDTTLIGEVIDLLDIQFTIRIHEPSSFQNKTHFIFYSDEWRHAPQT